MQKLEQNPYLVSLTTAFGTQEEEYTFACHPVISDFLEKSQFNSNDIYHIVKDLDIHRTIELCVVSDRDINELQNVSEGGLSRFTEIVLWARNNKEKLTRKIAAMNRLNQRLGDLDKEVRKNHEK
jgi:hypothetical protein